MLKIKNSVDLKELEKFGFKPKYDEYTGEIIVYEKIVNGKEFLGLAVVQKTLKKQIRIFKKNENIWIINQYRSYFDIDTLYDLIKADMVEKV